MRQRAAMKSKKKGRKGPHSGESISLNFLPCAYFHSIERCKKSALSSLKSKGAEEEGLDPKTKLLLRHREEDLYELEPVQDIRGQGKKVFSRLKSMLHHPSCCES